MMHARGLRLYLWCDAAAAAVHIRNRVFDRTDKIYTVQYSKTTTPVHKIVGIVSKRFSREQRPYSVHKKEALALTLMTLRRGWATTRRVET